ncbi:MAG: ribosome biogenesis GTPase Der [Puniceicoccales bacterium]|jgi:GTP-binding protein|nr:ribosome biogenesis GTPase Der [Puniceicoccales bacterium]
METTTNGRKTPLQIMLVGRPNVGKSRLFNRLCGRRVSIVHDQAGVTRDIIPEEILPGVILMDTGGIGYPSMSDDPLANAVEEKVNFAIAAADLIFFVVDASMGCLPLDFEIAQRLRRSGKPIRLLANKVDLECHQTHLATFHALGLGSTLAVSAEHGRGEEDIRQEIYEFSQKHLLLRPQVDEEERPIGICFSGRPNVGKSSLINALLHEKRTTVSPLPGTTRDSISFHLKFHSSWDEKWHFQLIDTAGIKAKKKINSPLEYFSQIRTEKAIEQAHIVFLVIDALSGISKTDQQLSRHILDAGKGLVVVVNKWDLAEQSFREGKLEDYKTLEDFRLTFQKAIRRELPSVHDASIVFTSAHERGSPEELLAEAHDLFRRMNQSLSTGKLNRALQRIMEAQPPAAIVGRRLKIYYAVQTGNFPFTLKMFCNQKEHLSDSYKRYLENSLRKHFPLKGCSLRFEWVGKEKRYRPTFPQE